MLVLNVCVFTCQVSQLYDVVQKWDAMSTSIPQVVQRLVAVKELHEQGNAQQLELVYWVFSSKYFFVVVRQYYLLSHN